MKKIYLFLMMALALNLARASNDDTTAIDLDEVKAAQQMLDSINGMFHYQQSGEVKLANGIATLKIPAGFKFINAEETKLLIEQLWGNPPSDDRLGMLIPEKYNPTDDECWGFVVTYDELGYIKDKDADDINYDELLADMKKETAEANIERKKMGYGDLELVGWASKPFYDKDKKVLHWAKELRFDSSEATTLNYDIRVLGRKGILSMNAVAAMTQLSTVKPEIDKIVSNVQFTEGNTYKDFDPDVDEVAAWTIGGLVAGKVLAKVGLFAVLAKFWKIIALGAVALGAAVVKFVKKPKPAEAAVTDTDHTSQS